MTVVKYPIYFLVLFNLIFLSPLKADVPVGPGDYTGSRNKSLFANPDGGLDFNGGLGSLLDYSMTYNVSDLGGGNFRYFYEFSPLIDVSLPSQTDVFVRTGATIALGNIANIEINGIPLTPAMDVLVSITTLNGVNGVLFDPVGNTAVLTVGFDVNSSPVWGDFQYGSTDLSGNVRNTGFGQNPSSPFTDWVPTPGDGGEVPVPEPATYFVLAGSLVLVFMLRQRRKVVGI